MKSRTIVSRVRSLDWLYLLRHVAAAACFALAVAVAGVAALLWLVTDLSPVAWGAFGVSVGIAVAVGALCVPGNRPSVVEPWDTIGGLPIAPDSPWRPRPRRDPEVAALERMLQAGEYLPSHELKLRPAVPPVDEPGPGGAR